MYANDIMSPSQCLAALLGFLLKKPCLRKQLSGFHTMVSKWERKNKQAVTEYPRLIML